MKSKKSDVLIVRLADCINFDNVIRGFKERFPRGAHIDSSKIENKILSRNFIDDIEMPPLATTVLISSLYKLEYLPILITGPFYASHLNLLLSIVGKEKCTTISLYLDDKYIMNFISNGLNRKKYESIMKGNSLFFSNNNYVELNLKANIEIYQTRMLTDFSVSINDMSTENIKQCLWRSLNLF